LVNLRSQIITFEACRVPSAASKSTQMPQLPDVDSEESKGSSCAELAHLSYDRALERGNVSTAVYFHDEIVAFGFDARCSTTARDGLEFATQGYRYYIRLISFGPQTPKNVSGFAYEKGWCRPKRNNRTWLFKQHRGDGWSRRALVRQQLRKAKTGEPGSSG
jgi:hypothetical protein